MSRQSKFLMWINYRISVTLTDTRVLVGTFLAFDKHMNLVLSDTEEYSRIKAKNKKNDKERKRSLGLVLIRGDSVISLSAESPPPENNHKRFNVDNKTLGVANPINRDIIPVTNIENDIGGLTSIGKGVGIPNMNELNNKGNVVPPKMAPPNFNNVPANIKPPIMPPPQPPSKGKKDKKK